MLNDAKHHTGSVYAAFDYGASGDGVTDDLAAVQAAVGAASAAGGGTVFLGPGTFRFADHLRLYSGVTLAGAGAQTRVVIDHPSGPSVRSAGIYAYGTIGPFVNLTADAPAGATGLAGSGIGTGVSEGDLLFIRSNALALTGNASKKGELAVVHSASPNAVRVQGGTFDSYLLSDAAAVAKMTPVANVSVRDLHISNTWWGKAAAYPDWQSGHAYALGDCITPSAGNSGGFYYLCTVAGNSGGVRPTWGQVDGGTTADGGAVWKEMGYYQPTSALIYLYMVSDATVSNVTAFQNNGAGVAVVHSRGVRVSNSNIYDLRNNYTTGLDILGYGVVLNGATQNVAVTGNDLRHSRHGFTTGHAGDGYGVPRNFTVSGNTVSDCLQSGIDTHEDAEAWSFTGNTVTGCTYGGITTRGCGGTISGNTVMGTLGIGIEIRTSSKDVQVTGNTVTDTALDIDGRRGDGIWLGGQSCSAVGNLVRRSAGHGIAVVAGSGPRSIVISGNTCLDNGRSGAGDGINVACDLQHLVVVGNICSDSNASPTQRYGIGIEAAFAHPAGATVQGNSLLGNAAGPFSNAGKGTIQTG